MEKRKRNNYSKIFLLKTPFLKKGFFYLFNKLIEKLFLKTAVFFI